jgi:hypothetical protein
MREATLFAAIWFLVGGLDDWIGDLIYLGEAAVRFAVDWYCIDRRIADTGSSLRHIRRRLGRVGSDRQDAALRARALDYPAYFVMSGPIPTIPRRSSRPSPISIRG